MYFQHVLLHDRFRFYQLLTWYNKFILLDRFSIYQLLTWYNKFIQLQGFVCAPKDQRAVFTTQSYTDIQRYIFRDDVCITKVKLWKLTNNFCLVIEKLFPFQLKFPVQFNLGKIWTKKQCWFYFFQGLFFLLLDVCCWIVGSEKLRIPHCSKQAVHQSYLELALHQSCFNL